MDEFSHVSDDPQQETHPLDPNNAMSPQFGLIDVIEAFTALRHEYRSQIKESRTLNEQLDSSTQRMIELENKLAVAADAASRTNLGTSESSDKFAKTLIDIDIQLSRAVEASIAEEQSRQARQQERYQSLKQAIAGQSRLSRIFARPVIDMIEQHQASERESPSNVADGLSILLTKLRQALRDQGIQRQETAGKPFDGESMRSIGVLASDTIPSGHVSQQLSPAYIRNQKIIHFAEVRVAP